MTETRQMLVLTHVEYVCIYKIYSWAVLERVSMPGDNFYKPLGYRLPVYCVIQINTKPLPLGVG